MLLHEPLTLMTPFFQRPGVGGLLRGLCPDGGPGSGLDPIVVILIIIIINVNMHIYIHEYIHDKHHTGNKY